MRRNPGVAEVIKTNHHHHFHHQYQVTKARLPPTLQLRSAPPPVGGNFFNCWTGDPHFVCRDQVAEVGLH